MVRRVDEIDVYRSAALLIQKHGEGALYVAAQRCDQMTDKADGEGVKTWRRIIAAVEELICTTPGEGVRTH